MRTHLTLKKSLFKLVELRVGQPFIFPGDMEKEDADVYIRIDLTAHNFYNPKDPHRYTAVNLKTGAVAEFKVAETEVVPIEAEVASCVEE